MSDYESPARGHVRDYDVSYTSKSHASYTPAPRTPAEQASDEIACAVRSVNAITGSIEGVRQAHAANDPARWHEARGMVDRYLAAAEKEIERARTRAHDAEPAAQEQLAVTEATLAQHVAAAADLADAPRGWKQVAREAEILAILQAPAAGVARSAFAQKEAELKSELARLSPAESHHLAARLNKRIADDPVAAAIARFVPERRARIVAFLGDARRRAALTKAHSPALSPTMIEAASTAPESGDARAAVAPRALDTSTSTSTNAVAEPITFETQVRHMIDARDPDVDALAAIDGTRRRAMARRLEGYRPGNGDPLGARYVRLDRDVRQRFLDALLGSATAESHEQVAARGVDLAAAPLPFADQIQKSFGRHDVSSVRVATDSAAIAATTALGARAYALGDRVALSSAADLHTVAHEAAHTIQQRGHFAGDAEAHADAVADLVVRGESAACLLDQVTVSNAVPRLQLKSAVESAPSRTPAVVHTPADLIEQVSALAKPDVAWAYLRANEDNFVAATARRLSAFRVPVNDRIAWQPNGLSSRFGDALHASLGSEPLWIRLPELLYPADPWRVIDEHRTITNNAAAGDRDSQPLENEMLRRLHESMARVVQSTNDATSRDRDPKGPLVWNALAGDAIANEIVARMHESMDRMIPRYVAQLDAKQPAPVLVADLVTSHPFDRIVARLLCDDQIVKPVAAVRGRASKRGVGEFRDGVQFLTDYRWLGGSDHALWNWIEVREPRDARVEDVAATLWLDPSASQRAYGITASPPYFRIEPSWARMFDDAKRFAPAGFDQPHEDNALAIAASDRATDAAIAQAAGDRTGDTHQGLAPKDLVRLRTVLDQSYRQLERIEVQLAPWKLSMTVLPAINWVRDQPLLAIPASRQVELAPVIDGQQEILFEVTGAIAELAATAGAAAAVEGAEGDVSNVLRAYATAAGESHLVQTARVALAQARAAKGGLALALLERSAGETRTAIANVRAARPPSKWVA